MPLSDFSLRVVLKRRRERFGRGILRFMVPPSVAFEFCVKIVFFTYFPVLDARLKRIFGFCLPFFYMKGGLKLPELFDPKERPVVEWCKSRREN